MATSRTVSDSRTRGVEQLVGTRRAGGDEHRGLVGSVGQQLLGFLGGIAALPFRLGECGVQTAGRFLESVGAAAYRLLFEPHGLGVPDRDLVVLALGFGAQLDSLGLGGLQVLLGLFDEPVGLGLRGIEQTTSPLGDLSAVVGRLLVLGGAVLHD